MKDVHLLPHILPNVFSIATALSPTQFASLVLPSLKPLFTIKDPPQNMLTLLDNLSILQNKTEKGVFRERGFYIHPSQQRCTTELLPYFALQMCYLLSTMHWSQSTLL